LLPQRALETGPIEQNQAREMALAAFPPEARLRKVGMDIHRKRLTLTFDFPARAQAAYGDIIEQVIEQSGWDVTINPGINQQALGSAIDEVLPTGGYVVKGPSYFMDRSEVAVEVAGVADAATLAQAYFDLTGFRLLVGDDQTESTVAGEQAPVPLPANHLSDREPMEINAAYGLVRQALEPLGLYRVGVKQGVLVLTFVSPQVGERHTEIIRRLSEETGYNISIHPHPNQQQILQIAGQLAREAGWHILKGPGIHVDRAEVSMKLVEAPDTATLATVQAQLTAQTGYTLVADM
jgi:hypothetical protein